MTNVLATSSKASNYTVNNNKKNLQLNLTQRTMVSKVIYDI